MNIFSFVVLLFVTITASRFSQCYQVSLTEVCDNESFDATCPRGNVMIITEAWYGHMEVGRCVEFDTGHLGCNVSVLDILSTRCTGHMHCQVQEDDPEISSLNPCRKGPILYLEVGHICTQAQPVNACAPIRVDTDQRFLSSMQARLQNCQRPGSLRRSHFLLEAKPGRKIKISSVRLSEVGFWQGEAVEVGYLLDEGTERIQPLRITGGGRQDEVVATSDSNSATLSLHQGMDLNFMLVLQASGCEDMQKPKDMWLDRNQDELTVGCLNSRKSWSLRCEGVHWRGVIGNCTEESLIAVAEIRVIEEITMAIPRDVVLMIIFAATAVLALIIVTSGYVSYKRSALLLTVPQQDLALLHSDIKRKASDPLGNGGSVSSVPQGPQYTLMRVQENPSHQQPPPLPPRKDNYSAQTTLNLRDH